MENDKDKQEMSLEERQYDRLIEARNFQYESYNRWLSYFCVFIGALWVAYYSIIDKNDELLKYVILVLGYAVSLCSLLSCKGAAYWWTHWNMYLVTYERKMLKINKDDEDYRSVFGNISDLKKLETFSPISIANVSSSKVVLTMLFLITIAWGFVLSFKCINDNILNQCYSCNVENGCIVIALVLSISVTMVLVSWLPRILGCNMENHHEINVMSKK